VSANEFECKVLANPIDLCCMCVCVCVCVIKNVCDAGCLEPCSQITCFK
jgi:hypothetical protein